MNRLIYDDEVIFTIYLFVDLRQIKSPLIILIFKYPKYPPSKSIFNPFFPNAPFFDPLKTSENRKVFWCFQAVEKGCIGNKWVNMLQTEWSFLLKQSSYFLKTWKFKNMLKSFLLYRNFLLKLI